MMTKLAAGMVFGAIWCVASVAAQDLRRATVWDLKLGQPISALPPPREFRGFACGSNGGAPRQQLSGWHDFMRCRPEADGLREVYFEYDDEFEYIARAKDLPREVSRWAGTTETDFAVIVSALFDETSILRGIRVITDLRPEYRSDTMDFSLHKRPSAYLFGALMAARHDVDAARDCIALPASEGEASVGDLFIKRVCEKIDRGAQRKILIRANLYRKPGQSGFNPQQPTQLTRGQFESSARIEIMQVDAP
jgi:hypothetical protein